MICYRYIWSDIYIIVLPLDEFMKKEDLRVTHTKQDLRSALLVLLAKEDLESITVQSICKEAGVNKMTFYRHYSDKYALLDDCIRSNMRQIVADIDVLPCIDQGKDLDELFATFSVSVIESFLAHHSAVMSIELCSNSLGSEIVRNAVFAEMRYLISMVSRNKGLDANVEEISTFLTGGIMYLALRATKEGKYDRNRYFFSFKRVFALLFDPKERAMN